MIMSHKPIDNVDSVLANNILKCWDVNTEHINLYISVVYAGKSIKEVLTEKKMSRVMANKIVRDCYSKICEYINRCGYDTDVTVDDDVLKLGLPHRIYNVLARAGIPSIEVLRLMTNEQLLRISGIGLGNLNVICKCLNLHRIETNLKYVE